MKVTILCAGKLKESYWKDGVKEYEKRLRKYADVEIIEVPDEKTREGASVKEEEKIRDKEGERLLSFLKEGAYVVTLEIKGAKLDSVAFSKLLSGKMAEGKSHFIFVIGGSLGLSWAVSKKADFKLSFSDMTFPHQMMRVILLEQIYRGMRIMKGEPYHK